MTADHEPDRPADRPVDHDADHDAAPARSGRVLVWAGIVLVALSLRTLVAGLGPLLGEIRADLHLSGAGAGVVTTLPVLCFAVFGMLGPALAGRIGLHRAIVAAMACCAAGLIVRAAAGSPAVFGLASALALAGVGVANVVVPALVRTHFPDRVGLITGVYAMLMQGSAAISSAVAVPLADGLGGWRLSLGSWAATSALALLPWLGLLRETPLARTGGARVTARRLLRSRTAWAMTFFFGLQSAQAYVAFGWLPAILGDAGVSARLAGLDLGIVNALGVPVAILLPVVAARMRTFAPLMVVLVVSYVIAYAGLLAAPAAAHVLWAVLLGVGAGAFPLALTLIGLRARTGQGTSALSGFAQGAGYLVAAAFPFLVGVLHDATGGWTVSLLLLIATVGVQLVFGLLVSRVTYVEDELSEGPPRPQ